MNDQEKPTRQSLMQQTNDYIEDEIDLREYLSTLIEGRWMVVAITALFTLFGAAFAILSTPIYQADALLQVEQKKTGGPLGELSDLVGGETPTDAEIEIIKSRSVIGKVVNDLKLDIVVSPNYFPVIGAYVARTYHGDAPNEAMLGADRYAWGGEHCDVVQLAVPDGWIGHPMVLVVGEAGAYTLHDEMGETILSGTVGTYASQAGFEIFVRTLTARPGTEFSLIKTSWLSQIGALSEQLSVTEQGKQTSILSLKLKGVDGQRSKMILDAIANTYLKQNVERKSEEASQALAFIQSQMPDIKSEVLAAETVMNEYRLKKGSVDLSMETQSLLDQIVGVEKQRSALELERAEISKKYTAKHPVMVVMDAKSERLNLDKARLEASVKVLPKTEQELLKLAQNVKVNQDLYEFMLNKAQELKVAQAGTVGDVRILDYAMVAEQPIKPKRTKIVALALMLGMFVGVVLVLIRKAMHQGIEDPELLEKKFGLSVYTGIPHSDLQASIYEEMRKKKGGLASKYLLAKVAPKDMSIESLRSLRTNLYFGLLEAKNNVVMLTGPSPDIGKSFVSVNFSQVLGDVDKKVLLIDADLRKGHLHEYIGANRQGGLSEVISGTIAWREAIQHSADTSFDLMSTGILPPNPAELLMHPHFSELLHEVSQAYDIVFIDTPPVLAATDAVIIGKHSGTVFMLTRSGRHPVREIQQSIRTLENGGVNINGAIFNDIKPRAGYGYGYGYGYGSYHYQYQYDQDKKKGN
ncbi:MAG: polysaccharide biosynthesis tyrosine autokinase, partial [Zetaproteobacteria bacterium]|nr:polysaccharide biosynthesis tyrosine autokinase [Zetaproteobacteria bacterium]